MLAGNQATAHSMQVIDPIEYVNGEADTQQFSPSNLRPPPPPLTIIPTGGGFLNPDGFIFTSGGTTGDALPVQYAFGPATATLFDAAINTPTLDPSRVFAGSVSLVGSASLISKSPALANLNTLLQGFFARNLTVTTSGIDFSPYTGLSLQEFAFFSSEDLSIVNNLALSTFATEIVFFAGNQLSIAPGVTITGNAPSLEFDSTRAMNLNSVQA